MDPNEKGFEKRLTIQGVAIEWSHATSAGLGDRGGEQSPVGLSERLFEAVSLS